MRILVVYYSRTGTTRTLAEMIAQHVDADLAEIGCLRYGRGVLALVRAVFDSVRGTLPAIEPIGRDLAGYDLVIMGAPVWASHAASPLRRFLEDRATELPHVAFFLTHGGSPVDGALAEMEELAGKPPLASIYARKKDLGEPAFAEGLAEFGIKLKVAASGGEA